MLEFACGALAAYLLFRLSGRWHARARDPRGPLRWLFRRLDTTHGQEKVIVDAAEALRSSFRDAKEQLHRSRTSLGEALRAEEFSHERVADAWVRQDEALEKLRLALSTGLHQVHETLDPRQRATLAELLEHGPRRVACCA